MTINYDEDQRVPNLNTLESGTLIMPIYSIAVTVESDSDSLSSQLSNDSAGSDDAEFAASTQQMRSGVESSRLRRNHRTTAPPRTEIVTSSRAFPVGDSRSTILAMRSLAARIVRKAARNGRKRMSQENVLKRLMKRDIERRDRYISELREGNRLLELQMRETEAEVERLFETFFGRVADSYPYNDGEFE